MNQFTAEKPFEQPWHASAFALTVHLHETGLFSWTDWAEKFSETLTQHGADRDLDGSNDYYIAWIATLQEMLAARGITDAAAIDMAKERWAEAYLATPHGEPVHLEKDRSPESFANKPT